MLKSFVIILTLFVVKLPVDNSKSNFYYMTSLLPTSHSEFHTKDYWDSFFLKRGNKSFEWYGRYEEIAPYIKAKTSINHRFLVIGCGNSDFSSKLYDLNYKNVINLDFSDKVIDEMKVKNKGRSGMRWIVGDMTNMHQIEKNSIDIVFDKGALDALLSENSFDCKLQAKLMFAEIERVLVDEGAYICITLAQEFVIQALLDYFTGSASAGSKLGWSIIIEVIVSRSPSPFVPFIITITKTKRKNQRIQVLVDSFGQPASSGESPPSSSQVVKLVSPLKYDNCLLH